MKPFVAAALFACIFWYIVETQPIAYAIIGLAACCGFAWGSSEDDVKRLHARIDAIWKHFDP